MTSPFTMFNVVPGWLGADACEGETLDNNHPPDHPLDDRRARFCRVEGFRVLKRQLKTGGVFGLWSDKITGQRFLDRVGIACARAEAG